MPNDCMERNVSIIKIGGSSITDKARFETLDESSLKWFANCIFKSIDPKFVSPEKDDEDDGDDTGRSTKRKKSFVIIHGAGSFGHHSAKKYGLSGKNSPPLESVDDTSKSGIIGLRRSMTGLARTRHSVQKLNSALVSHLIGIGINAIGVSPCSMPGLHCHGGDEGGGVTALINSINEALAAGLVPVIHGDAGLYGSSAGILSGDTLVEIIAMHKNINANQVLFLTDVAGVYTKDPNLFDNASLMRRIDIDPKTGNITSNVSASGSSHKHDVTGGFVTKLGSASKVALTGIDVLIAKCSSRSAEEAINGEEMTEAGTIIRLQSK